MPLRWDEPPERWQVEPDGTLSLTAGPKTDLFIDPRGTSTVLNAPRLLGTASGDYMLSARVSVDFGATFDAGALLVYAHQRAWAKLCFEFSPQRQPMTVSVVTHEVSDDCNSFVVDGNQVWLRLARLGPAWAFHASTDPDGRPWQFIRHFSLQTDGEPELGFVAQSPTGPGCTARFDRVRFVAERLADLRSGV